MGQIVNTNDGLFKKNITNTLISLWKTIVMGVKDRTVLQIGEEVFIKLKY